MDFNHFIFYLHLLLYLAHVLLSIVRHDPLAIRSSLSLSLVVNGLDTCPASKGVQLIAELNAVLCANAMAGR